METDCLSCGAKVRASARFCPFCGMAMPRNSPVHLQENAGAGIELDQIDAADCILIHTRNSEYRFSLIDPAGRRGVLSGGEFGDSSYDATLVGAVLQDSDPRASDPSSLRTDARALFYLRADAGIKRFTTSLVTGLVHLRHAQSPERAE